LVIKNYISLISLISTQDIWKVMRGRKPSIIHSCNDKQFVLKIARQNMPGLLVVGLEKLTVISYVRS